MAPLDQVRAWLMDRATPRPSTLTSLTGAHNRVLAEPIHLPQRPPHPIAAIDGLAIRATDTEGASDNAPIPLHGAPIIAGQPLPPGTDAVLPPAAFNDVPPLAFTTAAPGSFIVPAGHDVPNGALLPAGTVLRPLHLVMLAQAGIHEVPLVSQPRVGLEPPSQPDGLILMLTALIHADCASAEPSQPDLILRLTHDHATTSDTPPTIGNGPSLTLPADPLRCLTLFTLLVAPALRRMGGRPEPAPIPATLARKVTSALGQFDAIPIRLDNGLATPLGHADGGSLFAATNADALLLVPENSEGYPASSAVEVHPLR